MFPNDGIDELILDVLLTEERKSLENNEKSLQSLKPSPVIHIEFGKI